MRMSLVCACLFLAAACGDDDTTTPDAAGAADAPSAADGPSATDGPSAPDAPGAPDAPSAIDAAPPAPDAFPPGTFTGRVNLSETVDPMSGPGSSAGALFTNGPIFGTPLATDGECTLYASMPSEGYSAGTITITGGTAAVTLDPSGTAPNVTYSTAVEPPVDAFAAGATLTMSAAGSPDIPAFTGDVTAPEKLMGWTAPTSISRAAGWSTTWTAGTADTIWLYVVGVDPMTGDSHEILCATADDGAASVPASALGLLPAAYTFGAAAIFRINETIVAAGSSTIHLYGVDAAVSDFLMLMP